MSDNKNQQLHSNNNVIEYVNQFKDLFNGNFLFKIPNYQRPYSWEIGNNNVRQVDRFF